MSDTLTGQEIQGYKIGPLLGAGGMGEVYQGISQTDQSAVAIKFLRRDNMLDTKAQGRFAREIRIMQDIDHPNIIPVYGSGIFEDTLFYIMHLVNGQTLSTFIRRRKLSPLEFFPILEQLISALAYGHAINLVHRDIKPDNVFIERNKQTNRPHIYLGDFGLGKQVGVDHNLTEADAIIGTPHYMPPEAVLGDPLTPRADIYSLGVLIYEVLVGKVPFSEDQGHLTAMAHVTKPVPLPSVVRQGFPRVLELVILRAMEKSPDERYQTVQNLLEDYITALNAMTPEQRTTVYSAIT